MENYSMEEDTLDSEASLFERMRQLAKVMYETRPLALMNIIDKQESQRKTQNVNATNIQIDRLPIGTDVMIRRSEKGLPKLDRRFEGPYKVSGFTNVGNYKLKDPTGYEIDGAYPLHKLKVIQRDQEALEESYEIDRIEKTRMINGERQYYVYWKKPYEDSPPQWLPIENFNDTKLIDEFNQRQQGYDPKKKNKRNNRKKKNVDEEAIGINQMKRLLRKETPVVPEADKPTRKQRKRKNDQVRYLSLFITMCMLIGLANGEKTHNVGWVVRDQKNFNSMNPEIFTKENEKIHYVRGDLVPIMEDLHKKWKTNGKPKYSEIVKLNPFQARYDAPYDLKFYDGYVMEFYRYPLYIRRLAALRVIYRIIGMYQEFKEYLDKPPLKHKAWIFNKIRNEYYEVEPDRSIKKIVSGDLHYFDQVLETINNTRTTSKSNTTISTTIKATKNRTTMKTTTISTTTSSIHEIATISSNTTTASTSRIIHDNTEIVTKRTYKEIKQEKEDNEGEILFLKKNIEHHVNENESSFKPLDDMFRQTFYEVQKSQKIKQLLLPKPEPRYNTGKEWVTGPFKYCPTYGMNHVINTRTSCKQLNLRKFNEINAEYYVIDKIKHVFSGPATVCKKSKITYSSSENFFGAKFLETEEDIIEVDAEECKKMRDSKTCENNVMECNENTCKYVETPTIEYNWMTTRTISTIRCEMYDKFVFADSLITSLFGHDNCLPIKLSCRLSDYTMIWDYRNIHNCAINTIMKITADRRGPIVWDKDKGILFNVIKQDSICGMNVELTSEGLYITKDVKAEHYYSYDEYDLTKINLASQDAANFEILTKLNKDKLENCRTYLAMIEVIKKFDDSYTIMKDYEDNDHIVYSKDGVVYKPNCMEIHRVKPNTDVQNRCTKDGTFIKFEIKDSKGELKMIEGILSNNNAIIKHMDHNKLIECSKEKLIPLQGNYIILEERNTSNMTWKMIYVEHGMEIHLFGKEHKLNFRHAEELLKGIDLISLIDKLKKKPIQQKNILYTRIKDENKINSTTFFDRTKINNFLKVYKKKIFKYSMIISISIIATLISTIIILCIKRGYKKSRDHVRTISTRMNKKRNQKPIISKVKTRNKNLMVPLNHHSIKESSAPSYSDVMEDDKTSISTFNGFSDQLQNMLEC